MQFVRQFKIAGYLNTKLYKWFHIDIIRYYSISKLRGYTNQQLSDMTAKFYDDFLSLVINERVIGLIEKKRQEGAKLVIASATLDCISKEVATRLNVGIQYSSELDYKDGVCQGKLKSDLLASKLCVLQSLAVDLDNCEVVTDNYSDSDIISKSKHAYLIQYANKPNKWSRFLSNQTLNKCDYIII